MDAEKIHTLLNVFEVCEYMIRLDGVQKAERYAKIAWSYCEEVFLEDVVRAAQMRHSNRKTRMSMADCIGYVVSQRLGIKFLTGDRAFKSLPNVEFIPA